MKQILLLLCIAIVSTSSAQPYIDSFNINQNTSFNKSSSPRSFYAGGSTIYFSATDSVHGRELWSMSPGDNFPKRLTDINSGTGSSMGNGFGKIIAELNGKIYFSGTDGSGTELWMYDGNIASKAADLDTGTFGGNPAHLIAYGGKLYFSARSSTMGTELWEFDPATNNAKMIKDIRSGSWGSNPSDLTVYNGKIYYSASDSTHGSEVRSYDPATGTESLVEDINVGTGGSLPSNFTVVDGKMYFSARTNATGTELHVYDGTNIQRLTDLASGTSSGLSFNSNMEAIGSTLYFAGQTSASSGSQLYKYESGSATLVQTINSTGSALISDFAVMGTELFFKATNGTNGTELWKYDGTNASMVADLVPGSSGSFVDNITTANSSVFFSAGSFSGTYGTELYRYSQHAVGVQNLSFEGTVKLYPNPTNDVAYLNIDLQENTSFGIQIIDMQGRVVFEKPNKFYNTSTHAIDLPTSSLTNGNYVYTLTKENGTILFKGIMSKQ